MKAGLRNWLMLTTLCIFLQSLGAQGAIEKEIHAGVEIYTRVVPGDTRPWIFIQAERLFEVILPDANKLPFGKSVAFLVGVSNYKYLSPQLPYVKNDLDDMKNFLLNEGGFDVVYVVRDAVATPRLIKDYMLNRFRKNLNTNDRLLFYYSGHGADLETNTGYIQLSGAKRDDFVEDVLPIDDCLKWSDQIDINHMLFIYDCCNSGLGFESPAPREDFSLMINSLSKKGSRTVVTAGTANEQTFEVKEKNGRGNGVFTRAFLDAVQKGSADHGKDGFITIDEIVSQIRTDMSYFSKKYKQSVTPRGWPLEVSKYRGTFVFVNPQAKSEQIKLRADYGDLIAAKSAATGGITKRGEYGILSLFSNLSGAVYIDNSYRGKIVSGEGINVTRVAVGERKVEIRAAAEVLRKTVTIEKGKETTLDLLKQTTTNRADGSSPTAINNSRKVLRATPNSNLSTDAVKKMLKEKSLVDSDWNKNVNGFSNLYETRQNGKVVYDRASNLSWQQSGSENDMTYEKAKAYIRQLNEGDGYAGFTDWRLPTLEEGMSLMEKEKLNGDLYIDPLFDKTQRFIWTSDQLSGSAAWVVGFSNGDCIFNPVGFGFYVRAVRSGQSAR